MGNRDQAEGQLEQTRGTAKEKIGHAIGDKDMEYEGKGDRAKGTLREGYGDVREELKDDD
ncbi:MAG TPA: CsbD family protein [Candidatus Limnocylindria bacterium]|jgi:uncharacterized protein YjbJ (UPF0337 family)|nr:CsbD family protein [Candidatus Limnocylindria bacterium]